MSQIDWGKVAESTLPWIFGLLISAIGKVAYDYRRNIVLSTRKLKLKFLPTNFQIALSFDFNEGLNSGNYYHEIRNNLNRFIADSGIENNVRIRDFSDIKLFSSKEEAERFRNQKQINLVIWGGFSGDTLRIKGQSISKININFTFGHPENKEKTIGRMILLDISSRAATKNYWQIMENDSLKDIEIVSNNLFDIAMYILALTMKVYGLIDKSMNLFEKLYANLTVRNDDFKMQIIPHLFNCYELTVVEFGILRKNFEKGIMYCKKILSLNDKNFFAISNLAVFQYRSGEVEEAEKNVNLLEKLYPNNPTTQLDLAFFRVLQKKYSKAFEYYERFLKFDRVNFSPQEVIEFLGDEYQSQKEPALLYASGIVSYVYGDKAIAKEDFLKFLKKSNERDYKKMYRKAKKILSNLK